MPEQANIAMEAGLGVASEMVNRLEKLLGGQAFFVPCEWGTKKPLVTYVERPFEGDEVGRAPRLISGRTESPGCFAIKSIRSRKDTPSIQPETLNPLRLRPDCLSLTSRLPLLHNSGEQNGTRPVRRSCEKFKIRENPAM